MIQHKNQIIAAVVGVASLIGLAGVASAQPAVTQTYTSDTTIQQGMIVQLDPNDASKIKPATQKSLSKILGIVVAPNDAPVALTKNNGKTQLYVANFGQYKVLVSDQNGQIRRGDYINMSSLAGIGMKADNTQNIVVGKALASFNGQTDAQSTETLKNNLGRNLAVHIGTIPVDINIGRNPLLINPQANLPGFLEKASQGIADKPVSAARVYLSLAVLVATTILAGSVLYAGIRSGMIAMGRNPLAKRSIIRNLLQVVITSFIVFLVGIFAVYLLLKL